MDKINAIIAAVNVLNGTAFSFIDGTGDDTLKVHLKDKKIFGEIPAKDFVTNFDDDEYRYTEHTKKYAGVVFSILYSVEKEVA